MPSPKGNPGKKQSAATSIVSSAHYNSQPTNSGGSSGGKVVHVRGYTRSNGTCVASYTRSFLTKKSKTFAAVTPVSSEAVPIATTGGSAQIAKCTRLPIKTHPIHGSSCSAKPISGVQPKSEHIKKELEEKLAVSWHQGLKRFHRQPLLDTTNTIRLPTSRVSEQQKFQSKEVFKQHTPPLATEAKRDCSCPAQTAVQGS